MFNQLLFVIFAGMLLGFKCDYFKNGNDCENSYNCCTWKSGKCYETGQCHSHDCKYYSGSTPTGCSQKSSIYDGTCCAWDYTLSTCGESCCNGSSVKTAECSGNVCTSETDCSSCTNTAGCLSMSSDCSWNIHSVSCENKSTPKPCLSDSCNSCGDLNSCLTKKYCSWNPNGGNCFTDSSKTSCYQDKCINCKTYVACSDLSCTWNHGFEECDNALCDSSHCGNCTSQKFCRGYPACSWIISSDYSYCQRNKSYDKCTGDECYTCSKKELCIEKGENCFWSGGKGECYDKTMCADSCSSCTDYDSCNGFGPYCGWRVNVSDPGSCTYFSVCHSDNCTDCYEEKGCSDSNCEWNSDENKCDHAKTGFPYWLLYLIIGLGAGGLVLIVICCISCCYFCCRKKANTGVSSVEPGVPQVLGQPGAQPSYYGNTYPLQQMQMGGGEQQQYPYPYPPQQQPYQLEDKQQQQQQQECPSQNQQQDPPHGQQLQEDPPPEQHTPPEQQEQLLCVDGE